MRRTIVLALNTLLFCSLLFNCGHSNDDVIRLFEERDSLKKMNDSKTQLLNNYGETIEVLNATLDSICVQENMIFTNNSESPITKEDVKRNLLRFEELLRKQEAKIIKLEKLLTASNDSNAASLGLISHLREQINEKNVKISQIMSELEKKNVDIKILQSQVEAQKITIESQTATISELNNRTLKQGEALAKQDALLNNGYVLIGTKSDLKRKGVVKKGKLLSDAILDRTKFAKVDIRIWREISFKAKRPRILTNMPATSYELTTSGDDNFTLNIKDPSVFWRISNYLVIQTD